MANRAQHRTAPVPSTKMPKGIPYIVGNEAAERFSYYGMKAILVVFMTQYLIGSDGGYDVMSEGDAKYWFHTFNMAVYAFPLIGAIIADAVFGKYKTILTLSIVYCFGHLALALDESRVGMSIGLTLIAIGSGGIKPCVSAHVGDQFGKTNAHLLEKVFGWFYFAINLGAFASTAATPVLLAVYGPHIAFGLPGLLMMIATFVFWMGRHEFVHIPPQGKAFVEEALSARGIKAILQLGVIYIFVAMFWALFDQTGSAWVLQAQRMDLQVFGIPLLPSQVQAVNPILVMLFIPFFAYLGYPAISKVFPLTPLRKISIGLFIAVPAFLIPAQIETWLQAGESVSIGWQLLAYIVITIAEIFVSITALEYSYTQAPKKMKSLVMGFYLLSVSLGNFFTAGVNHFIQQEDVVVESLAAKGSHTTEVTKDVSFELSCERGEDSTSTSKSVAVELEAKKSEGQDDASKPKIVFFTDAEGAKIEGDDKRDRHIAVPGSELTLVWKTENTQNCVIRPGDKVETSGEQANKVKDGQFAFNLKCDPVNPDHKGVEAKFTIVGTEKAAIRTFDLSDKRVDPTGGPVTLTWEAVNVDSCKIMANTSTLSRTGYYLFFAGGMFIAAFLFIFVAIWYKPKTYIQDEEGADDDSEAEAS